MVRKLASLNFSISGKSLIRFNNIISLLFILSVFTVFVLITTNQYEKSFLEHHKTILKQFVEYSREDYLSGDHASVYQKCLSLLENKSIHYVKFIKVSGGDICQSASFGKPKKIIDQSVYFDEQEKNIAATVEIGLSGPAYSTLFYSSTGLFFLLVLVLVFSQNYFIKLLTNRFLSPFKHLTESVKQDGLSKELNLENVPKDIGIEGISDSIKKLLSEIRTYQLKEIQLEKGNALYESALHLSHNINTPLSTLKMSLTSVKEQIPKTEFDKIMQRINRIDDIANNFLIQNKKKASQNSGEHKNVCIVLKLLQESISEVRSKYRGENDVSINFSPSKESFKFFSLINDIEIRTVISNLLVNSVQAKDQSKENIRIDVELEKVDENICIIIKDNGKGLPIEVLNKFKSSDFFSYNKENGNGIGLKYAKQVIEKLGGKFELDSIESVGTTITISLPATETPRWLITHVLLPRFSKVYVLDDEVEIHDYWKDLLSEHDVVLEFYSKPNELLNKLKNDSIDDFIIFCDYDLGDDVQDGASLLRENGLLNQSFLVTSHYSNQKIMSSLNDDKFRVIPKDYLSHLDIVSI